MERVASLFTDTGQARRYVKEIHHRKPRYIRDQLQAIEKVLEEVEVGAADQALAYCIKHGLYRAVDYTDAANHFHEKRPPTEEQLAPSELKLLAPMDTAKLKAKPEVRDFTTYKRILEGE